MAKCASNISSQISSISKKELEKLVLKAAAKDKSFHDYLLVNYFDKEYGEQDLFQQASSPLGGNHSDIRRNRLGTKFVEVRFFSEELKLANMLGACAKRVTEFSKSCKNKNLEADLLLYVLAVPFSLSPDKFGTCFTAYNYKVVALLKRLITLVESKMHADFKIEYQSKINGYLSILHRYSSHLDYVYSLQKST
jgi:hypothetical protein